MWIGLGWDVKFQQTNNVVQRSCNGTVHAFVDPPCRQDCVYDVSAMIVRLSTVVCHNDVMLPESYDVLVQLKLGLSTVHDR